DLEARLVDDRAERLVRAREPAQLEEDVLARRDGELDGTPCCQAQLVDPVDVVGVRQRDPERHVVDGVRDGDDTLEDAQRDQLHSVGRHAGDGEVDEREAMALGEHARPLEVVELDGLVRLHVDREQARPNLGRGGLESGVGVDGSHQKRLRYASRSAPPANSATTPPSARNGPNGLPILLPLRPRRPRTTPEGTSAASMPTISPTGTVRPSAAPRSSASLTSPIPMPPG